MADEQGQQPNKSEVCPICGGVGWVRLNVPPGDPRFGKAIPCRCKRQQMLERKLAGLRQASNLDHLKHMTFESFDINTVQVHELQSSLIDALDQSRTFAENPEGWILLTGPYGCGKTHLAAAIANRSLERGMPLLFVVVPDLLDYLRAAYAPSSTVGYDERFEQVRNVELLILDDLGTQNATPWAVEKLYQILNYRYISKLPTVITTNLSPSELDPRLASRFRDHSLVHALPLYSSDQRNHGTEDAFGSLSNYSGYSFDRFLDRSRETVITRPQLATLDHAVQVAEAYSRHPHNWLLIRGGYGVGKTHLAAAIANKASLAGSRVLFVVVSDLLDMLRATFQAGSAVSYDRRFGQVRRAWMLVLDDLGVENATPWAQEKLFQILNYRYVAGMPTVITTSDRDWQRLDERLQSRLLDTTVCTVVDIDVPSYRGVTPSRPVRRSTRTRQM